MIRILIADDHAIVREGLRLLLLTERDLEIVGEASDGVEAVETAIRLRPDVVLMDLTMPRLNGIAAIRRIREAETGPQVIVLSMHASAEHIRQAFQAGARGYLAKVATSEDVAEAIRRVHRGEVFLSASHRPLVLEAYLSRNRERSEPDPVARLSSRELEVLQHVVEGRTSAEIARLLNLSPKTVESYRSRLMQKLELEHLPALVKFAIQRGLADPDP